MAHIKKLSAFRQLSLNCETPTTKDKRKHFLKKQFSEDFPDIQLSFGNKTRDRPPNRPIKIAWDEDIPREEAVIIKKCQEIKRPISKLTRHNSLEKDSILYPKQHLEDRLREAFKKQDEERKNLNIFLSHNNMKEVEEIENTTITTSEVEYETTHNIILNNNIPKIIPPLLTTELGKNIFQLRKPRQDQLSQQSKTVVVVPVIEAPPENKPIDVIIRPQTAALKRQGFQKRTNSAFNETIKDSTKIRPPLVRSSSAPSSKPERAKCKFIASKRKLKSSKRKKIKEDDLDIFTNQEDELGPLQKIGSEVVTMVSLVSPTASDCEDSGATYETDNNNKVKPSIKNRSSSEDKEEEQQRNLSNKKGIKSVSFQQSSIHAIRNFSASFPARRNSMANPAIKITSKLPSNQQENKRATANLAISEDERGPKRRHLRNNERQSSCEKDDKASKPINEVNIKVNIKSKTPLKLEDTDNNKSAKEERINEESAAIVENDDNTAIDVDGKIVRFGTIKEKECWEMYRKMIDRGINVTYDAILRGMLTPTEYRMRKKEVIDDSSGGEDSTQTN